MGQIFGGSGRVGERVFCFVSPPPPADGSSVKMAAPSMREESPIYILFINYGGDRGGLFLRAKITAFRTGVLRTGTYLTDIALFEISIRYVRNVFGRFDANDCPLSADPLYGVLCQKIPLIKSRIRTMIIGNNNNNNKNVSGDRTRDFR